MRPRLGHDPGTRADPFWAAYGVCPDDISCWSFTGSDEAPGKRGERAVPNPGLTVYSPLAFTVADGALTVHGPNSWQSAIRTSGSHLIVRLPLVAANGSRVLVLPPAEPLPDGLVAKATTYSADDGHLEVVWEVTGRRPVAVPVGRPLARIVAVAGAMRPAVIESGDCSLRIWRLHPHGVTVRPAERTLNGAAASSAVRWCGPFAHANAYGFWVFPPVDLDVIWHGGRSFEHQSHSLYTDEDASQISRLQRQADPYRYVPRKKVTFGSPVDAAVSIWTGCIFQTPPGWALMIRNPINVTSSTIFCAQEAILETDWLPYDIWINLLFLQQGKWARLRRGDGWPPIAQLVPVPRAAYDGSWDLVDGPLETSSASGQDMYARWQDYNHMKWVAKGEKDPATYYRKRALAKQSADTADVTAEAVAPPS